MNLTLHEAASEMHPKWQGSVFMPPTPPIETSLEAILAHIFHIIWIEGQKSWMLEKIFKLFY